MYCETHRKKLKKLGDEQLVGEQIRGFIPGRNTFKFILLAVALSAAARTGAAGLGPGPFALRGQSRTAQ